jgi:asparagine synthase (glutamine-hydrolysing)
MCGIALLIGPGADQQQATFDRMVAGIRSRGEVLETDARSGALLATSRLRIVDRDRAVQPWTSVDGRYALCYNGEVFNHGQLRAELIAAGRLQRSESDTEVVLESLLAWDTGDALLRMRGEFAFALLDRETGEVLLGRDPAGVKPLYWARTGGRLYVASEVKALTSLGARVHEVPPGHVGRGSAGRDPQLAPYIDLLRLGEGEPMITDVDQAKQTLRDTFADSVRLRVDTDLPVGVLLSGGLDSSLTLLHAKQMHPDVRAFTVGTEGSEDLAYARRLAADLGVPHEVVSLRPRDIRLADVRRAIERSEATEYGDVINAVVSLKVFERVHACGVKVLLTGDGSDELFGGYDMYAQVAAADRRRLFLHKIRHLSRTELQRVDRTSMGLKVEARVPFLDVQMLLLSMRIPLELKVRDGYEKWIVRETFADLLPDYIKARHKNPMSHSSGLHERVRLYKPLFPRIYNSYRYGALGPMRRDFSVVLAQHGNDLGRAVDAAELAEDYTPAERVRDLAGAVRWNVTGALVAARRGVRRSSSAAPEPQPSSSSAASSTASA